MEIPDGIGEFLTTRRARLTPEQAKLPTYGGHRRVPGLRREEVALLAGMSPQYYVRLERGNATGVSESMLEGIARALQLDAAERDHLHNLVLTANAGGRRRAQRRPVEQVRPGVQQTLDAMVEVPAIVQNGRLDVLAANRLGTALWTELFDQKQRPANFARYVFLDLRARDFYRDWEGAAQQTVALLRSEAGRVPFDPALTALVGQLSMRSDRFRTLWASHDVREHRSGTKLVHHRTVGDLDLAYEGMDLASDKSLLLVAYTAPPGSVSHDGLRLLSSWTATNDKTTEAAGPPAAVPARATPAAEAVDQL